MGDGDVVCATASRPCPSHPTHTQQLPCLVLLLLQVKKSDGSVQEVTVQRPARAIATPVRSSLQQRYNGERVGVIRLTSFNARALRDVSAALDRLQEQGAMEHVLDLRDNMWISGL